MNREQLIDFIIGHEYLKGVTIEDKKYVSSSITITPVDSLLLKSFLKPGLYFQIQGNRVIFTL